MRTGDIPQRSFARRCINLSPDLRRLSLKLEMLRLIREKEVGRLGRHPSQTTVSNEAP